MGMSACGGQRAAFSESVLSFRLSMALGDQTQVITFVWQKLFLAEPSAGSFTVHFCTGAAGTQCTITCSNLFPLRTPPTQALQLQSDQFWLYEALTKFLVLVFV